MRSTPRLDKLSEAPTAEQSPAPGAATAMPRAGLGELSGRLAGLSLPRQVLVLAIWPLLEQFLNFAVSFVDLMLAARLNPEEVGLAAADALSVSGFIGWLMGMLYAAVGVGSAALVARALGARHRRLAHAAAGQSVLLALVSGLGVGAVIFMIAPYVGQLAELNELANAMCTTYLRFVAAAAPLAGVLFVGGACLRGAGDTRTPFFVMVVVNLVNTALSLLFVFGPAPIGGHGVAGIAAGTALAWSVGAMLIFRALLRGDGGLKLRLIRLRPHWHTARRILRVGIPNLLESLGMWVGNFLILMIVGSLVRRELAPDGVVGAHMIAVRLESVSFLMGMAIGIAGATLAGQYLGAGRPDRAKQAVGLCWALAAALMTVMGLLFVIFPEQLVGIISDKPLHHELVPPVLRLGGAIQAFFATYIVLAHSLRGAGDTPMAMRMTYASTFLVRLPGAWLLGVTLNLGFYGIWIALCGELVVRGLLFAGRYLHGGWTRVRV